MTATLIPREDLAFIAWARTFFNGLQRHNASLELTPEELAIFESDLFAYEHMVKVIALLREETLRREAYKTLLRDGPETPARVPFPGPIVLPEHPAVTVRPGILSRIERMVEYVQSHPSYSLELGQELGLQPSDAIESAAISESLVSASPYFDNGEVKIDFELAAGNGVRVDCATAGGPRALLGYAYMSPFIDPRPSSTPMEAEARVYRLTPVEGLTPLDCVPKEVQVIVPAASRSSASML